MNQHIACNPFVETFSPNPSRAVTSPQSDFQHTRQQSVDAVRYEVQNAQNESEDQESKERGMGIPLQQSGGLVTQEA